MKKLIRRVLALALGACLALGTAAYGTEPETVTRGDFVRELYAAHQARTGAAQDTDAAAWASGLGVLRGYGDGQLRLEEPLSRAQAAVMLYRYAGTLAPIQAAPEAALAGYADAPSVPAWCRDQVAWAVESDLWFSGSSRHLGAGETVTAEECEALLAAVYQNGMPLEEDWSDISTGGAVTLDLKSASAGGAVCVLRNAGQEALTHGADYGLYRRINGGWYQINGDMAVIAIAYTLEPGGSWEFTAGASGPLPAGSYRVVKHVTGERESCRLAVDFTIAEA